MKLKRFNEILMRTAAVLLILVMLSTALVTGRYARYVSSDAGSDAARVASFSVTETGELLQSFTVSMGPGEDAQRSVTVTNRSEVTVDYYIYVSELYGFLPLDITVTCAERTDSVPFSGTLSRGETATFTLNLVWPEDETDTSYAGKVDCIDVTLITVQKD